MSMLDDLEQIVKSIQPLPQITLVGGKDNRKLLYALGCVPAANMPPFSGVLIHVEYLLPDDFLLCATDDALDVYQLQSGELKCFRVLPEFPLYRVWMHIIGKYRGKG